MKDLKGVKLKGVKRAFMLFTLFLPFISPQQQPPFRAAVDLVEVDVTVVDRNGKPVTDLSAADFEIRERGETQRIDTIFLVTGDPSALKSTGSSPAPPAPPDAAAVPRRPLPPRVFVFVLDMAHLSPAGLDRTRQAIRSFFTDGMRPLDLAGLVVNGVMLGNRIVSDKSVLLGQLDGIGPPNSSRLNEMRVWPRILSEEEAARIARGDEKARGLALQRACTERQGDCEGPARHAVEAEVENKSRLIAAESARDADTALATMLTLSKGLGRFPGPKSVLLFSEGFYTGDFQERLREVAGLAARNRVRISTLDARGLGRDLRQQQLLGEAPVVGVGDFATNLGFDEDADVLTTLALDTGGQRVRDRNDLRPALDAIAAESGTYYMLGYSPRQAFDGSYRSIEVRVRRSGVTVRARRGYLASRPGSTPEIVVPLPVTSPNPGEMAGVGRVPGTAVSTLSAPPVPAAPPRSTPEPNPPSGVRLRPDGPAHTAALAGGAPPSAAPAPDLAARLAREGWDLYSAGKVEAARERLAEASGAGAGLWVDYALGLAEFALDHFDAAVTAWERVRAAKPDFEPVYFDLADAFRRLERTDDSLAVLREAARRWPSDAEAHNAVGVTLVGRGAYDDALQSFNRAIAAAPDDPVGYYNLGRTYELRYGRLLRSGGQDAVAVRSLADVDRRNAIEAYKKCVARGGPYAEKAQQAISVLNWR
jgi:VWFA-related protein